jgi:SAM-dependent methyltransferase
MTGPSRPWRHRGFAVLERLGVRPSIRARVSAAIEAALDRIALDAGERPIEVLDAGCGHRSPLVPFRARIGRLVGVDLHAPDPVPAYLDDFLVVDLCGDGHELCGRSFDLILSSFTIEHLHDPDAALRTLCASLRPGGVLVASTVNRRHPFVGAYLALPAAIRDRLQPGVKASPADAHPLVGACNDPARLRAVLADAGFEEASIELVPNLAHAWGRHPLTFALGALGDLLCQSMPSRRSTILISASRPAAA